MSSESSRHVLMSRWLDQGEGHASREVCLGDQFVGGRASTDRQSCH